MIQFNELRVTPDNKKLIIDASVKDLQYYNNVYIDAVIIDTQDTYVANGPSTKPIFSYEVPTENETVYSIPECNGCTPVRTEEDDEICFTGNEDGEKRVRLELDSRTLGVSLDSTLFFVYIVAKGVPSPDTPCGMDNQTTLGVVANLYPFYRSSVNYMKEVENDCDIPREFIDSILRFKAFELSIKTGHYTQAIKYWNKFFKEIKSTTINTGCKCYGGT